MVMIENEKNAWVGGAINLVQLRDYNYSSMFPFGGVLTVHAIAENGGRNIHHDITIDFRIPLPLVERHNRARWWEKGEEPSEWEK